MKKMITALMVFVSISAMAKLTVFNAQNALDLVANDEQLLESILTSAKATKLLGVDAEQVDFNQFEVVVSSKKGKATCRTLVDVKAVMSTVVLPGGGRISANNLKVLKVSKAICK